MKKSGFMAQLNTRNALHQATIAIILISLIPLLALVYMSAMMLQAGPVSPFVQGFVFLTAMIMAAAGLLILLRFPKNIMKLRRYVTEVAAGALPDKIRLLDTRTSDDLLFIEQGLNIIIEGMRHRIEFVEQQLLVEQGLRKTIEEQQQGLLRAERHRAMIQSLGAASHHIGQPLTNLKMRHYLMEQLAQTDEELLLEIEACQGDIALIVEILDKLRMVSEFRTTPYVFDGESEDCQILAI